MIKTVAFMSVQQTTLEQKLSHKYFNNMNCFPPPARTNPDENWICKLRVDGRQRAIVRRTAAGWSCGGTQEFDHRQ